MWERMPGKKDYWKTAGNTKRKESKVEEETTQQNGTIKKEIENLNSN